MTTQLKSWIVYKTWLRSSLIAVVPALLSFPVWQQIFKWPNLPVQVQMSADNVKSVKVYWDNPERYPNAYETIPIKPTKIPANQVSSNIWQIKIEALAEKTPEAKDSQVWIADISTPENRVDWSKAIMGLEKWELRDNPYGPQGKIAIARTGKPQSLEATVQGGNLTIALLRSPWGGKVRVTANSQVQETNLYAASPATEKLYFEPIDKNTENYDIKVVKTPWHRLKIVPESAAAYPNKIKIYSVRVGDKIILAESNGEFILPFYFWNKLSYAIAATAISFLGLTFLFIIIASIHKRNPQLISWQWFSNHQPPRAIIKLKIANKQLLILPYQSFKYFLASLAVIASGLLLTEGYLYYQEKNKIIKVRSALPFGNAKGERSLLASLSQPKYQFASMSLLTASNSQARTQPMRQLPQLSSPEWQQEDARINQNNKEKILTSGNVFNPAQG